MSNIDHWEKLIFSKLWSSQKENLKKCTNFEEQKGTSYIWGNVYVGIIIFCCLLSTKPCLRFRLNCFVWEVKGFYQSSFGNEVDFMDIMNISLNILAKNKKIKKLRHSFVGEGATIKTTLMSSCHWKRSENALVTLTVNYRKIVQTNKLCHSKQQ